MVKILTSRLMTCISLFIGLALSETINVVLFYICNMRNPKGPKPPVGVRNRKKLTELRFLRSILGDNENKYKLI
jgi:hypothetical protein